MDKQEFRYQQLRTIAGGEFRAFRLFGKSNIVSAKNSQLCGAKWMIVYNLSEALFRMLAIVRFLQRCCKILYFSGTRKASRIYSARFISKCPGNLILTANAKTLKPFPGQRSLHHKAIIDVINSQLTIALHKHRARGIQEI